MSLVLIGTRFLLAGVFAAAGFAKLADREGSRRAVEAFGVPRRPAWLIGGVLPFAELATAGALLPPFSATWGALAAAGLLLSFSAAIAFNLARGRTPECRCFGQVHSAPVSWRMVARNVALAVGAAAVVAGEGVVAVGAAAVLAVVLLAREAPGLAEGLAVGTSAPRFESLAELLAPGRPVLLVFASQNCGPCLALAPELEQWRQEHAERLTISVLEREDDGAEAILEAYKVDATPVAVLVGPDGRIASSVAPGATAIRALVSGEPAKPVEGMRRREFLLRVAGTVAMLGTVLQLPARAVAAVSLSRPKPCRRPDASPLAPDECGGEGCTNVLKDWQNCGLCGKTCDRNTEVCAGGRCNAGDQPNCGCYVEPGSPDGSRKVRVCCDGQPGCIDLNRDVKNCGRCGNACTGVRPSCCNGVCVDLDSDPAHCGGSGCGRRCPPDKPRCDGGTCLPECKPPLKRCGQKCGSPQDEICCGGHLYDKERYPPGEYICCEGKPVKPIMCGGKPACPGTKTNRDAPGTCCHRTILGKNQGCCRGKVYDKTSSRCCKGKIVPINEANCLRCGNRCKDGEVCRFHDGCICPLGEEKCSPPLPHP